MIHFRIPFRAIPGKVFSFRCAVAQIISSEGQCRGILRVGSCGGNQTATLLVNSDCQVDIYELYLWFCFITSIGFIASICFIASIISIFYCRNCQDQFTYSKLAKIISIFDLEWMYAVVEIGTIKRHHSWVNPQW